MEKFAAIKKIASMVPADLVSFLGRFGLQQCHTMIITEQIHGEEFLNMGATKMQPYLTKTEQDHVLLIRTCILDNPVDFVRIYETTSPLSSTPQADKFAKLMDRPEVTNNPFKKGLASDSADNETVKMLPIINSTADLTEQLHLAIFNSSPVRNGNRKEGEKPALPQKPKPKMIKNGWENKYDELLMHENFCNVSPAEGVKKLKTQPIGSFLIRLSNTQFCTLMVKTQTVVRSVQITQKENRLFLYSSKMDSSMSFPDISSLISHFKINHLPLEKGPVILLSEISNTYENVHSLIQSN